MVISSCGVNDWKLVVTVKGHRLQKILLLAFTMASPEGPRQTCFARTPLSSMTFTKLTSIPKMVWTVFILLIVAQCSFSLPLETVETFSDPEGHALQRMVVHDFTGAVYIGGTNKLHKLSSDLTLLQTVASEKSSDCHYTSAPCSYSNQLIGQTKGLVIDYAHDNLIYCNSLHCHATSLSNITNTVGISHKPVVPHFEYSSVLFTGPSVNNQQALYIGAEDTAMKNDLSKETLPIISSRNLVNFDLVFKDKIGATQKIVKELRSDFHVKYIHGFVLGDFVYFLSVQKENATSNKSVTRIGRVCTEDRYFHSYLEISLYCEDSLMPYHVLQAAQVWKTTRQVFAVFGKAGKGLQSVKHTGSVLCVVDMDVVDREFDRTVQQCYDGVGTVGPAHFETVRTCNKIDSAADMCGRNQDGSEGWTSLEGQRPVVVSPIWTLPANLATALALTAPDKTRGHGLVYVGTENGQIIQVLVAGNSGHETGRIAVDSRGPVVQIQAASDTNHLYVLSSSKVSLLAIGQCEDRESCGQCMAHNDPQCGWCTFTNKCTRQSSCEQSSARSVWLPSVPGSQCPQVNRDQPPVVSYDAVKSTLADQQIRFYLEQTSVRHTNIPYFTCVFVARGSEHKTLATLTNKVITCPLPDRHLLPVSHDDYEDSVLRFHVHSKSIVTRSISVPDCNMNSDCSSCTNSSQQCQWCFRSGKCLRQSDSCLRSSTPSTSKDSDAGIRSSGSCPLVWMSSRDKEILVHSGGTRRVAVQVRNLREGQSSDIKCHFTYLGSHTTVPGKLSAQSLTCDSVKFDYPEKEQLPYVTADFKVSWGPSSLPLDNSQGIQVRIYKCSLLVTNCGKCLSMDPEYECGWCGDRCTLQKHCPSADWLDRTATCPGPQILRFNPSTGPIKGRTTVSVTGLNLGKAYTDITGGVKVAGVNCEVNPQHYEPSSEFVCETEVTEMEKKGTVMVVVDSQYTAVSDSNFTFVDPKVTGILPKTGPRSGGTTIVVKGLHMETGSDVSVAVGGVNCGVIKRNFTTLECVTPKQSGPDDAAEVKVNFGGHTKAVPEPFTYVNDPIITMIEPKTSIVSGGTSITVIGMGLDLIQNPEFFVTYGGQFFAQRCEIENTLAMECQVPSLHNTIQQSGVNVTENKPLEVHYGFSLDGVTKLKNVSHEPNFGPLQLYPDPVPYTFSEQDQTKMIGDQDLLIVSGEFSTISKLMGSVSVQVGREECQGVSATDTEISCQPPSSAPDGTDSTGKAPVFVRIGHVARRVGFLRYYFNDAFDSEDKPLTLGIILGVVIPIVAIMILLTICVIRRHRKHRPATNYIPDVLQDYQEDQAGNGEEMVGLTQVTVVDVTGQVVSGEDCGPYISDIVDEMDETDRANILATIISHSTLHLGHLIGKGHFGAVYKAQLQGADGNSAPVSVKALEAQNKDKDSIKKFLQDMAMLKTLKHPHLLPMLGVSVGGISKDPLVISPFLLSSDLRTHLQDSSKKLNVLDLLGYGLQIADAMVYLEEVKIVHKNLASRNCLVSEDAQIWLTDYGITTALFPQSFLMDNDTLVRWMASESIESGHFSSKSDVWAFGVVLWELFTRGVTPYPDVDSTGLLPYLTKGSRLPRPKHSPQNLYELMVTCWNLSSDQRPDFTHLHQQLKQHTPHTNGNNDTSSRASLHQSVPVGSATEYLQIIA